MASRGRISARASARIGAGTSAGSSARTSTRISARASAGITSIRTSARTSAGITARTSIRTSARTSAGTRIRPVVAGFRLRGGIGLCLLVLLGGGAFPGAGWATTYWIAPDGSGDVPTIQVGVSAAVASDTLLLASGTFQGPGNRDIDLEGKAIVLRSKAGDPAACVIDCEGTSAQPHRGLLFLSAEPAGCRVEGIAIVNGYAGGVLGSRGGAILMTEDARPIFENCWIIGGTALSGGGIYLDRASPTFRTSLIVGNFAAIAGGGVVCQNNAWPLFEECVFARNLADVGGGLFCEWSLPTIRSCTFVANGAAIAGGIGIFAASTAILENTIIAFGTRAAAVACEDGGAILTCCDLYGNSGGDWTGCIASQENVNGNITLDPLFCDPENGDYHLHADSPCAPGGPVHPGCGLIGAWGAACGPTGTQIDSWGGLKARFRAQVTEGQAARTTTAEGAP